MNVLSVPHPVFRRIRGGNAFEETVERLLQAVKLGQVRPGDRLPSQGELALRLGISRVTLREAILCTHPGGLPGVARRGRSGGTFVLPTADWRQDTRDVRATAGELDDELTDALLLRQVLEPAAVELAARRAHPAETVTALREMLAEEQTVEVTDYRPIDSRLHVALADLAGSPSLTAAVADVRMRLNDLLDMIPLLPPNIEHSTEQHRRVVEAIVSGNPKAARLAMEKHLEGTGRLLRGLPWLTGPFVARAGWSSMSERPPSSRADDEVVELCRELIRIDTANYGDGSGPGERKAAEYVAEKLAEVGLEPTMLESEPGRTSVVARIDGADPHRDDALLVHGHLDVVPADADDWTHDPFSGEIVDDCVWGRGAIDMKDMDAMILAVIRDRLRTDRAASPASGAVFPGRRGGRWDPGESLGRRPPSGAFRRVHRGHQ